MKKTLISLATASLIASSAVASDKGIDFTTTGQAVVYYQTHNDGKSDSADLFSRDASTANVGIQLDIASDLKNGFTFGSQLTYLGTSGLEKNLVKDTQQISAVDDNDELKTDSGAGLDAKNSTTNQLMLTKIFIAKQIANTTVKIGRQELPQSLSPLAFTEGWNVFKNTFDAVLVVNTDIKDTTLVGAYVGRSTGMDLSSVGNLTTVSSLVLDENTIKPKVSGTAYMITVQNKSLPMTTITASYYNLAGVGKELATTTGSTNGIEANALWFDAKISDKSLPMGLKVGIQAGSIRPESKLGSVSMENTTAFGLKAGINPMPALKVCGAYTYVSGNKDGETQVAVKNTGTGALTPLYTQMIKNGDAISLDNSTFMLKGAYSLDDMGTVIARTTYTKAGSINLSNKGSKKGVDYNEFDLMYKIKVSGVDLLAAYVYQAWDTKDDKSNDMVRFVARYNF